MNVSEQRRILSHHRDSVVFGKQLEGHPAGPRQKRVLCSGFDHASCLRRDSIELVGGISM